MSESIHYGVILRKLREINKLSVKAAAQMLGRSSGWLSQIENAKGAARIDVDEFERIVAAYGGEPYRKQFGGWIARTKINEAKGPKVLCFDGAIVKYLRKKTGYTLQKAAKQSGISVAYLSYLENGIKPLHQELRDELFKIYGYSPGSYRNFTSEDKRAKNIPGEYKLQIILNQIEDQKIETLVSLLQKNLEVL